MSLLSLPCPPPSIIRYKQVLTSSENKFEQMDGERRFKNVIEYKLFSSFTHVYANKNSKMAKKEILKYKLNISYSVSDPDP